ncbi:hypothetical protein DPMN_139796 [Dreissena polymorpha]|uniref:Uncharacterized protein n=1 Tax=Dreissena polymorpha TaxID=45954 RepID=A0A9D4JG09_DREPO|nr:hypothetical protein DPMN_139796 [Dreissena polymorpha]
MSNNQYTKVYYTAKKVFPANHPRSCSGTPRDGPPGTCLKSLQLPQLMELKHVRVFSTTTHPPQPHHLVKLEISVNNIYNYAH